MKLFCLLGVGLILSLSAMSGNKTSSTTSEQPAMSSQEIEEDMNKKFATRDTFKIKGQSLHYLKVHH